MTFIILIAISRSLLSALRMRALIISIWIIIIEIRVIRTRGGVVIIGLRRLLLGAVPAATAIAANNIAVIMILISIGITVVIVTLEILTSCNSCPALVVIIFVINFVIIFVIIVIVIVIT